MPNTLNSISIDPDLAIARQLLYRFAALSMLDPQAGSWEQLAALRDDRLLSEAAALVRDLPEAIPEQLALGERPLADLEPSRVLARLPSTREQFNDEYEGVFGLLVANACPPYETEYIHSKFTFQRSNTLADISGFYRAFGLTTSSAHPERPDHIVQELEFMACLVGLERRAGTSESKLCQEKWTVCRFAEARFLREHLAWWTPAFAKLLSRENADGFFTAAGVFLAALIPAERALLGVEEPTQHAAPMPIERPESCDGCLLANP